jgi:putative NADPH-quinone reductase
MISSRRASRASGSHADVGDGGLLRSAAAFAEAPSEPDILKAREDVTWAEHLVFVFPLLVIDMILHLH